MHLSQQSAWHRYACICVVCGHPITGKTELLTAATNRLGDSDTQVHFYCQSPVPRYHSIRVAKWVYDAINHADPERARHLYYEGK
jgi:hypothetical protein